MKCRIRNVHWRSKYSRQRNIWNTSIETSTCYATTHPDSSDQPNMGGNDIQASTRKWYEWYAPDQSPEERKLVLKLDLLIVPYAFILYWVKYIDQTNISTLIPIQFSQAKLTQDN